MLSAIFQCGFKLKLSLCYANENYKLKKFTFIVEQHKVDVCLWEFLLHSATSKISGTYNFGLGRITELFGL